MVNLLKKGKGINLKMFFFSVCKSTTFFQQDVQLQFCGRPSFLYDRWLATEPDRSTLEKYVSNYHLSYHNVEKTAMID